MNTLLAVLEGKILDRSARIGIIGLGYVGLPEAVMFAQSGFRVTGFDVNLQRVDQVNAGESAIADVPSSILALLVSSGHLRASCMHAPTSSSGSTFRCPLPADLGDQDCLCICVPTPLRKTLLERGAELSYHDPHVAELTLDRVSLKAVEITPATLSGQDCVLILTDHAAVDYHRVAQTAPLVVDTRNALKGYKGCRDHIVKL